MTNKDFKFKSRYKGKNDREDYIFYTSGDTNKYLSERCGENIFSVPEVFYAKKEDVVAIEKITVDSSEPVAEVVDDDELLVILRELSEEVING